MHKRMGLWITLLLLIVAMFTGISKNVESADGSCTITQAPADGSQQQNQSFSAVITSASNQTSSSTFIRLENQNGFTLFTNKTAGVANSTGETATYTTIYSQPLDSGTYKFSAAFFYLNNSFYNYTATQFNCGNRSFSVFPVSGGFVVNQQQQQAATQKAQNSNKTTYLLAGLVVVIAYFVLKKSK